MAGTSNSLNITSSGIQTFNATTGVFTASTVTQYGTVIAGANNTVTSVAPSATSGVPLISQGGAANPVYGTAAIAGGGTNATSFTQSAGIVVYNGTSLVNYAGPQIDSSGRLTNTTQVAFLATQDSPANNVTGLTFTAYTLGTTVDLTEIFDQGANFDPTTGVFTAPITGRYLLHGGCAIQGGTIYSAAVASLITSNRTYAQRDNKPADAVNVFAVICSAFADMDAADTLTVTASSSGEISNTDDVVATGAITHMSGILVC